MSKKRILIVDDDEHLLNMLRHSAEHFCPDYVIDTAADGSAALDHLGQFEPQQAFALILSDYDMPGMNGLDMARAIRQSWPAMPIFLMSGCLDFYQLQLDAGRLNLDGCIQKPFGLAQIEEILQTICGPVWAV